MQARSVQIVTGTSHIRVISTGGQKGRSGEVRFSTAKAQPATTSVVPAQ
ncbi:MAG: hypothetical protein JSS95_10055 [Acidobacteria bacterium]|nr:hypothetical protein [Acidobacteriota bacterium]